MDLNNKIRMTSEINEKDNNLILDNLSKYNISSTNGLHNKPYKAINLYLRNEFDEVIGGILGITYCFCFQIENFWISDKYRRNGYGKLLITEAEKLATEYGCTFSFTGTFSYQAPDFYKKMGYKVFSQLDGFPDGIILYFLKKKI